MRYFKKEETIKLIPGEIYLVKSLNIKLPENTWFEAVYISSNIKFAKFLPTEKSLKFLPSLPALGVTRPINSINLWVKQI